MGRTACIEPRCLYKGALYLAEVTRVSDKADPPSSGDVYPQSGGSRFLRSDSFGVTLQGLAFQTTVKFVENCL